MRIEYNVKCPFCESGNMWAKEENYYICSNCKGAFGINFVVEIKKEPLAPNPIKWKLSAQGESSPPED